MTTMYSSYGSSPSSSYFPEFMPASMDDLCLSYITPDPDYFDGCGLPSIHDDVMKMETDNTLSCLSPNFDSLDYELKPEIRNIDCMWSANPEGLLSTSAGSSFSDSVVTATAVPLAAVTGNTQNIINNIKQEPQSPTVVVAKNSKLLQQKRQQHQLLQLQQQIQIKQEPSDDYEQQLQQHSIPNNSRGSLLTHSAQSTAATQQSMQHIPPGTSLLRKSNAQLQQQQQQQQKKVKTAGLKTTPAIQIPKIYTSEFLRERDQLLTNSKSATPPTTTSTTTIAAINDSAFCVRPDTPHSLDDDDVDLAFSNDTSDTTEFKHNVDLRACVIGSNNLSLTVTDPTHYINHVSQELQDTSKNKIDIRLGTSGLTLNDVLDVLGNATGAANTYKSNVMHMTKSSDILPCSDSVESDDEESLAGSNSASSIMDNADDVVATYNRVTQSPVLSQASSTTLSTSSSSRNHRSSSSHHHHQQQFQTYLHSDHSYTRHDAMDDLGPNLETPSDSDEEIDVVSIEKKLPTNPSDKDRRALQTKVADKFSNARIVKNANGVRTIPPRRSISYELPYTPASNSPVKSLASSRYPSPASTPYHQNQYTTKYVQQQQQMMSSRLVSSSQQSNSEKARKRLLCVQNAVTGIEYGLVATPTSGCSTKKLRGKKSKHHQLQQQQQLHQDEENYDECVTPTATTSPMSSACSTTSSSSSHGSVKRHYSLDETADTIEKRNLHNDMERQRRIGLKNLFEALKKQIPSIKDKERAPKVNILREAAKLCEALTYEDQQLMEQKAVLKDQMRKKKELLARLQATVRVD